MQILSSDPGYRIPAKLLTSLSGEEAYGESQSAFSTYYSYSVADTPNSISAPQTSLQASLAASTLDKAETSSETADAAKHAKLAATKNLRLAGETLAEAWSRGGIINPAEWLSPSDLTLLEKTTGATIRDGVVYDKDGNQNTDLETTSLINALFEMRNFGTFDSTGTRFGISGDITAEDLRGFIKHYQSNTGVYDMNVLGEVPDTSTSSKA